MNAKNRLVPLTMMIAGALLIGGAALSLVWLSPQNAAAPKAPILGEGLATQEFGPNPEIPRLTLERAKAAYDAKEAVFLDVRGDEYYQGGHIPGAISIAGYDIANRLDELNPSDWIIPYCT